MDEVCLPHQEKRFNGPLLSRFAQGPTNSQPLQTIMPRYNFPMCSLTCEATSKLHFAVLLYVSGIAPLM